MSCVINRLSSSFRYLWALSLFCVGAACLEGANTERPNIIVILSDDMGYSDLGAYGGEIRTPSLDRLASQGRQFTQFYNTARCCPSRASLMTGLYPHKTGIGHMIFDTPHPGYGLFIRPDVNTIAETLGEAGYGTYMTGKWHLAPRGYDPEEDVEHWPTRRGFDKFYGTIAGYGSFWDPAKLCRGETFISVENDPEYQPEEYFYTNAITDNAIAFLRQHEAESGEDPFFLYLSYTAAHWPLHAPEEDIREYDGHYDEGYASIRERRIARLRELGLIPEVGEISEPVGDWDQVENKAVETALMQTYAAMITGMDEGIGEVIDYLREAGEFDNTLILFMQDNGSNAEDWFEYPTFYAEDEGFEAMSPDAVQKRTLPPMQTRDGRPVLTGDDVMPGPADTYLALKANWANVSNAPFRKFKHYMHEGGISTPLIVHWPEGIGSAAAHRIVREPTHLIDIVPTCLEAAGVTPPTERDGHELLPIEGVSLMPLLTGSRSLQREEPLFWEHESNRAVRDGKWKLVAVEGERWELYDISNDRGEMRDLSAAFPETVARLAAEWYAWAERDQVMPYGGWFDRTGMRTLHVKQGDAFAIEQSPKLAKGGFTIETRVLEGPTNGVLAAQGTQADGFTLYMKEGTLTLLMRRGGKSHRLEMSDVPEPPFKVIAGISGGGAVKLAVDDRRFRHRFPDGFSENLAEGLSIGLDSGTAVGEYDSDFPFEGKLGYVKILCE